MQSAVSLISGGFDQKNFSFNVFSCFMLRIIILLGGRGGGGGGGVGGGRALSKINKYHFMFSSCFILFQIFLENKLLVRRGGGGVVFY